MGESVRAESSLPWRVADFGFFGSPDASVEGGSKNELYFASPEFPEPVRSGSATIFSALLTEAG